MAWIIINRLESDELREESSSALESVRKREMTGREFLFRECDEKFWSSDLNEAGNLFASYYYGEPGDKKRSRYITDYERILAKGLPSTYHVQDTWENYDKISAVIDQRYRDLNKYESERPWWKLW